MKYLVKAQPNLQTIDEFQLPREVNLTIEIPEIDSRIFGIMNYTIAQQIGYIEKGAVEWQYTKEFAIASLKEVRSLIDEIFEKCYTEYVKSIRNEHSINQ